MGVAASFASTCGYINRSSNGPRLTSRVHSSRHLIRTVRFLEFFVGLLLSLVGVIILSACLDCMKGCVSIVKEDVKKRKEERVALRALSTNAHPLPDSDSSPRASQDADLPCPSKEDAGDAASVASSFTLT